MVGFTVGLVWGGTTEVTVVDFVGVEVVVGCVVTLVVVAEDM